MKITILVGPYRKKPTIGDKRTTKKHGLQIRVPVLVHNFRGEVIGYNRTGGRQNYEWKTPAQLVGTPFEYLLKKTGVGQ